NYTTPLILDSLKISGSQTMRDVANNIQNNLTVAFDDYTWSVVVSCDLSYNIGDSPGVQLIAIVGDINILIYATDMTAADNNIDGESNSCSKKFAEASGLSTVDYKDGSDHVFQNYTTLLILDSMKSSDSQTITDIANNIQNNL